MMSRFFVVLVLGLSVAVQGGRAAGVEYPGLGNIELSEGTVEIWFTPQATLEGDPNVAKWKALYRFLELESPGNFSAQLALTQSPGGAKLRMRMKSEAGEMLPVGMDNPPPMPWKTNSPAKLALVWKGRWMGYYADGVLMGERTQVVGLTGSPASVTIRLGGKEKAARPWALQAVRVSAVARPVESLAMATPEADAATLLLDRAGDWRNVAKTTEPQVIAQIAGQGMGGVILGETKPGKDGLPLD